MIDLRERFKEYENVPVPDLWERVTDLATSRPVAPPAPRFRLAVAVSAALLLLLVIGVPLLVFGLRDSAPLTEPTPSTALGWEAIAVEALPDALSTVEGLPGGGFVALAANPARVFWSPDGVDWFDADPHRQLALLPLTGSDSPIRSRQMAATGDVVIILDDANDGVWLGDRITGNWDWVRLDVGDHAGQVKLLTVAANDREGLVVASQSGSDVLELDDPEKPLSITSTDRYLAWIISGNAAERHPLPIGTPESTLESHALTEWFNEQWMVVLYRPNVWTTNEGWQERQTLLMSPDGVVWSAIDAPEEWGFVTSLAAGPSTIIATTCHFGGDSFWYSTNGREWVQATSQHLGHQSEYVDDLGFVVRHQNSLWVVSADGRDWQSPLQQGVTLQPSTGDTEDMKETEAHVFAFDSRLWRWSRD